MEEDLPWLDYEKARLPRGFAHAIGRDEVEKALRGAGAEINSLSFGPHGFDSGDRPDLIFDVLWLGDGKSRSFGAPHLTATGC